MKPIMYDVYDIARTARLSTNTIWKLARQLELIPATGSRPSHLTEDQMEQVLSTRARYRKHIPALKQSKRDEPYEEAEPQYHLRDLAARLPVAYATLRDLAHDKGIRPKTPGARDIEDLSVNEVAQLLSGTSLEGHLRIILPESQKSQLN